MFSLITERSRYLRIRKGVEKREIISVFCCPVEGEIFCGAIIPLSARKRYVFALAGDTYEKIAARQGVDAAALKNINGGKPVYPTARVWLP